MLIHFLNQTLAPYETVDQFESHKCMNSNGTTSDKFMHESCRVQWHVGQKMKGEIMLDFLQ